MVSTPTIRGLSRIEREFEASDQRRYFVPCPHCGAMQWLRFERLRWDKGRPETATYHCECCEGRIAEHHKTQILERGEWRATAASSDPHSIGFHLLALYSPLGWKSWQQIARDWLAAQGSEEMLRAARNTLLGETWVESGDAPEWQRLAERREAYGGVQIPAGGLFLTAGVDVQKDRIEVDVWAWGRGFESWLVDHIVIPGGPDDPSCWDRLTALLGRTWATIHLRRGYYCGYFSIFIYIFQCDVVAVPASIAFIRPRITPARPLCDRTGGRPQFATLTFAMRSGSLTSPLRPSPRLIASTTSMPETTCPTMVYCPSSPVLGANMMKNCELALSGSCDRAMPTMPRSKLSPENSAGRSGLAEPPVPAAERSSPLPYCTSPVWAMKPSITRWNTTPS